MTDGDLVVLVHGEELTLMPERAAFWTRGRTLLVADPHFGKAAAFRAGGIPVPAGTTDEGLSRLRAMTGRTNPRRIAFLGDFLHARTGRSKQTLDALVQWRRENPEIELLLVRGNHDRHAGDPPAELGIECVDPAYAMSPFVLAHHPVAIEGEYVIAGHVHPGVRLSGAGRQHLRLPCFVFGTNRAILPAFGDFTGLADLEPEIEERIFAVAGESVVAIRGGGS